MKAGLVDLARALQKEIREMPESEFTSEQNDSLGDMEWKLQQFIEAVEGKCAVVVPAARVEERKVA